MPRSISTILSVLTLVAVYAVYRAASDIPRTISPQGCRMSWMSPSYVLQADFNSSWTPLANRYTLWLYREVGWEPTHPMGLPVLFIPGNAGSSHQVRSIASSATRQYFSSPFAISSEFTGRGAKQLDFYAVEFNEDLSAFHGPTLNSQIAYSTAAITYVLSRYPSGTQMVILGHSMGGVVGSALLPLQNISALVTMSTPHTLPPARVDSRIEELYQRNRKVLLEDATPILSLCGGATDALVPSESCVLPAPRAASAGTYRRTVFTSALGGAWTGVGHREMVWCHQVRWRVARAALELANAAQADEARAAAVLDRWLGDGREVPSDMGMQGAEVVRLKGATYEALAKGVHLVLRDPRDKRTYLLPMIPAAGTEAEGERASFVLYLSGGSVLGVAPHHAQDLRASVQLCVPGVESDGQVEADPTCTPLEPTTLKLLPSPLSGRPFPVPDEGSDESEGTVLFEGEVPRGAEGWIAVTVDAGQRSSGGWVVAGYDTKSAVRSDVRLSELMFGSGRISLVTGNNDRLRTRVHLPRLPLSSLIVYRLIARSADSPVCADPLSSPLLMHASHPSEVHYHPLRINSPILLHSHLIAPYVPPPDFTPSSGPDLTIYSPDLGCGSLAELNLALDWWGTLGRLGTRYPTTLLGFTVGVVSLVLFHAWHPNQSSRSVPESLETFVRRTMPLLMGIAALAALLPLGPEWYLGLGGELGLLAGALAAFLVALAVGLVCVSWWVLGAMVWLLKFATTPRRTNTSVGHRTIISMAFVLLLIFLFVPWQVAFLGCWFIQLLNCAACARGGYNSSSTPNTAVEGIPLRPRNGGDGDADPPEDGAAAGGADWASLRSPGSHAAALVHSLHQNSHILLFMTWLLPLTAPVLVVWVRTLLTAGYTTPFGGDHNALKVVPTLWLADLLGRRRTLETRGLGGVLPRWGFVVVATASFLVCGRRAYLVYDVGNFQVALLLLGDVVSRYPC